MADLIPTFEKILSGTSTVQTETWIDLGAIPTGKKIWYGYASFIAEDKNCSYEVRSNLAGQSAGTVGATTLHDWSSTPQGEVTDRDLYRDGNIMTTSVTGTGTEHWWLRVRAQGQVVGVLDYIFYYSEY